MHPAWQAFLAERGAVFGDHDGEPCVAAFDHADARGTTDAELTDLSPLGLLRIEGPDAARFFQGYATADVNAIDGERSVASALCTREGRTIATFRMWGRPDAITLRLHRALIVPVRDLLARYIVFSDAELTEPGDDLVGIGITGPGAVDALADAGLPAPETGTAPTFERGTGTWTLLRNRGALERYELWVSPEDAPGLWDTLAARAQPAPFTRWLANRIRGGFVELSPRTAGEYVPQALNLQALGLVDFDKGCYLGQEVVARMQYLGKVKRRLFRFSLEAPEGRCPVLGTPVHEGGPEGKEVGEVIAAAPDNGRCEMLAVIRVDAADDALYVGDSRLTPEPLPYEVPPLRAAIEG